MPISPQEIDTAVRMFIRALEFADSAKQDAQSRVDGAYRELAPVTHNELKLMSTGFLPLPEDDLPGRQDEIVCDPLRIAFTWTRYNSGVVLDANFSQFGVEDPISSYVWDMGEGIVLEGVATGHFYDAENEPPTRTVSLTITTHSGKVRYLETEISLTLAGNPYNPDGTERTYLVYATESVEGLPYCELPPV